MALARGRTLITTASHSRWLSLTRTTSTSVHRLHPSFTSPTDLRLPLPPSSSSVRLYSVRPPNHGAANPPIRTMALDGCDYEHWNVVMWPPDGDPSRDEIIDGYVKTLAQVLGSFGCLVSEKITPKIKSEPFLDGKAVPYDPKYHKGWVEDNNEDDNDQNEMDGEGTESNNILHNADQLRILDRQKQYVQDHEDQKKMIIHLLPPIKKIGIMMVTQPNHISSQEIHIQDGQCTLSVKNQDAVGHGEQGTSPTSNQELQNSNERSTTPPTLDQELKDINGEGRVAKQ
ncbi:Uncharacterized protein QJS10_CPA05g01354 [Acorus calamus]|uniref:MORF/ORRM1/DAG-like MORF domain-containing protein n=1 Tax=Acorus calamus TaxID=4465 RepID=A0AAV9EU50_ACOCL|nr:Uncharacterized protein QJS10_CPA05g01354 [Acorus calamus]